MAIATLAIATVSLGGTISLCTREIPDLVYHLCNGVVSHGAQIGGIWGFADHTGRNTHKQNSFTIFFAAFPVCLFSSSDRSTYAPEESRLFWSWEKPKYPQFEPRAGIKVAQVLGSIVYICDINAISRSLRMRVCTPPFARTCVHSASLGLHASFDKASSRERYFL